MMNRMRRLTKFAMFGFLGYAIATASPEQQTAIIAGTLAIKDAALDACQREGSLCAQAIGYAGSAVSGAMNDDPAPWLDDPEKRVAPKPSQTDVPRRDASG